MQTALERWHEIITARSQQMDTAYARLDRSSADFWDRRASVFHRSTKDTTLTDPLYLSLRKIVTPQDTLLDVGAGTGRFALALAPDVQQVIAIEPNVSMLRYLREEVEARLLTNITTYQSTWQEAPVDLVGDIVICSHVLYPLYDIDIFLSKLLESTRRECFITLRAQHFDQQTAHLWKHFHGTQRHFVPTYMDALAVLFEMGVYADVEVVKQTQTMRFPSLDIAVQDMLEQLILPDDEKTREELAAVLQNWLVERNGMLSFPASHMATAMIRIKVEA